MSEKTWEEGQYTEDDVIESADGTGYLSPSEFVSGDNGLEPDDSYDDTADDTADDTDYDTDY